MQRSRFISTAMAAAVLAAALSGPAAAASAAPWILEPGGGPAFESPAGDLRHGQPLAASSSWTNMLSVALGDAFPEWSSARFGQVRTDRRFVLAGLQDQVAAGLLGDQPTRGQLALALRMRHCWGTGVI